MKDGVLGISIANIFIVGIIALIFVYGYDYARKNWINSLPAL